MKNSEKSLGDLWETVKETNIHIMGVPKGEERTENVWSSNSQKLPKFGERQDYKHQRNLMTPSKINSKKPTSRHIIIKLLKAAR